MENAVCSVSALCKHPERGGTALTQLESQLTRDLVLKSSSDLANFLYAVVGSLLLNTLPWGSRVSVPLGSFSPFQSITFSQENSSLKIGT